MDMGPDIKNVSSVQFSILSPEEIKNRSVVEITKYDTYDKDEPVVKGLFDLRMGVTDGGGITCKTCHQKNKECPGHFGHIELARPVYNFHFMSYLCKILKCVCFRCSKILIDKEDSIIKNIFKKKPKQRFQEIYNICQKITRCGQVTDDGCFCIQPEKYKIDGLNGIHIHFKKDGGIEPQKLTVEYVRTILEKITDEDAEYIGLSKWCRPEWLICSILAVPPPSMRPSVKQDNSQRMDDDITHKLSDIVKCNRSLKLKIEQDARIEIIEDLTKVVQYHVATLVDNELPGINPSIHRSGRALKSIIQRLKGKEGRIRNNLMGKRVDFSARSVITPDPNIELDQLGVPIKIAMNLTFPEKVTKYNMDLMNTLIQNGPNKYPGAKSILKMSENIKITIHDVNKENIILDIGDIVHRHLLNDDYVLFNRQPSLHKMSMMGHRVRVMTGNTFRLNISVTPPYNADFDGDEMNMHAPQSIETQLELKNIMSVNYQIISPRENKPIITIVQDTLLGIYKLTSSIFIKYIVPSENKPIYLNNAEVILSKSKKETGEIDEMKIELSLFTKKQMMNIICDLSTFDGSYPEPLQDYKINNKNIKRWTGKQILSYILPKHIRLEMENLSCDDKSDTINYIKIIDGNIHQGTFDKSLFTKTSQGLIHTIYNDFGDKGPLMTKNLIDDLQKMVTYFLLIEGFSVGISDMLADKSTNNKIQKIINKRTTEIERFMQELHLDIFENYTGQSNETYFEGQVNSILNKTLKETGELGLSNLDKQNRATSMINSGSKGNVTNIAQMVACLGQQNVDGGRIPYGYTDRTLPHYYKFDDSSEARGFVKNSFISGQTPQEYFFHAMGGREGLIDTAVKTSETGYIQRKLIKAMEDLKVEYDYSVRTSSNTIVQFIYGDDGMDSISVESQPLFITKMDSDDICKKFLFDKSTDWNKFLTQEAIDELSDNINELFEENIIQLVNHKNYLVKHVFKFEIQSNVNYPVHIHRITKNICNKTNKLSDISPNEIFNKNEELKQNLYVNDSFKNNKIFKILVDIHLNPTILIKEFKIQKDEYYKLLETITYKFKSSKINPGEMVGAIAAQSIGEPATQMTLNTFHFAGVSAKSNLTSGIPRLRELLHLTPNLKSPSVKIFVKKIYNDLTKCNYIKNKLEYTLLSDIIISSQIYYDPDNNIHETVIDEDKEFLEVYKNFIELEYNESYTTAPWIIRFIFDKEKLLDSGILMEDIYLSIMKYDPEKIKFIYSDENSREIIGRISFKINVDKDINGLYDQTDIISKFKNMEENILSNVVIKGIKNITNIVLSEEPKIYFDKGEVKTQKEWILETDGTNMLGVFSNDMVDYIRTSSNDIIEIYKVLGIEATRNKLIKEITNVIKDGAGYINSRHVELLCDIMTSTGDLMSINHQGISSNESGPLAKCSFEHTSDQLIKSAIFGETDYLTGVSSNIMMGQRIHAGTNVCDILLDEEKLIQGLGEIDVKDIGDIEIDDSNIDSLLESDDDDDAYCDDDNFKMSNE